MKRSHLKNPSGALLLALALASCSQGPTSPSAGAKAKDAIAAGDGMVTGSAAGDLKSGPVDMDMNLVRVAQTDGVPAFYANPGGEYIVRPGREVEIYVQIWTSNPTVATPPRVIIDWGVGERDNIHCGPCRLSRTYATEGKYKVTVTLDDRVSSFTTRTFTLNVQRAGEGAGTFTFSNSTLIQIPTAGSSGPANPYPSSISVSGLGKIESATVTLSGLSHTYHEDLVMLLVSPSGQTVKLMDSVDSSNDSNNATITFQDGAPVFPDANVGPGSFTFRPTQEADTTMPGPAPNVADGTTLSTLNGLDPNGTWQLFVYDQYGGDIGQIAGGWSLTLTTGAKSSSVAVQASFAGVSASSWSNSHILNYPDQKPDLRD